MKTAWSTKLPPVGVFGSREDAALASKTPKQNNSSSLRNSSTASNPASVASTQDGLSLMWGRIASLVKQIIPSRQALENITPPSAFLLPEQRRIREQIEQLAESPFEQTLFGMRKKADTYVVSQAWAQAIAEGDPQTRESALNLLKNYLAYTGLGDVNELSAHTQMKFMVFTPHLTEAPLGKAIVYESLMQLPIAKILEFEHALTKDFASFSPTVQTLLLKAMMATWKNSADDAAEEDAESFHKLIKMLVTEFYTGKSEELSQEVLQQEKIRLGFLKLQPVEEAYRKQLEEIERRYRLKLRQLKKHRSLKVAEAEEEKIRRIELIYDDVEEDLIEGLSDLDLELEQVLSA